MSSTPTLPSYAKLYAFGDSLSDAGNLSIALQKLTGTVEPAAPPYAQETYQTRLGPVTGNVFSNGPTWVQDLSLALNLGTLAPSLLGGTDFAYGGAVTGVTPEVPATSQVQALSLPAQFAQFKVAVSSVSQNALFTLSIGSNDLLAILGTSGLTAQQQTADVQAAVTNEVNFVESLAGAGAANFLVMNVPDLGKTPDVTTGAVNGSNTPSAALDAEATSLSALYDSSLATQLSSVAAAKSLNIDIVNAYQLIDNAVADPSAYDLTNVTTPVWSGNYSVAGSGSLVSTVPATQDQYLFWDHLHPTETGEQQIAKLAEADLAGTAPCYAEGTRIATTRGAVAVEMLRVGDMVTLAEGGAAPVVWLGHRRVDCRRHPRPAEVQPVRILAHAFGLDRPYRDLLVSPDHAVFVDEVLIPARCLVNGVTVRQEDVAAVTYWHVELPAHGVLRAEGLPAESYLDTGNRGAFANGGRIVTAHPDFARRVWEAQGRAPLVMAGPVVERVVRRLFVQALALGFRPLAGGEGRTRWVAPAARAAM